MKYSEAIHLAIEDSMLANKKMMILGQGVWSPFYVGNTMDGIEKKFGKNRVIDTPVSENAVTGIALGIAISGAPALVIHPRMDFMVLAMDPIVNAAAKWRYALDWAGPIPLTIRAIINRGGEQGAQHSQSLYSWFAHIPGLRVVVPSSPSDAYYLLRSCINSPDPCLFIEDRWCYGIEEDFDTQGALPEISEISPRLVSEGGDLTIVSLGFATRQCITVGKMLSSIGAEADIIDLRVLNPMNLGEIYKSVSKTGKLLVIDAAWGPCSVSSEIISSVCENVLADLKRAPIRLNLPSTPAPTSPALENSYYFTDEMIYKKALELLGSS